MGRINVLSEEICNRIAAGEVIDRPYSVVKELVENSIDAGATEIEIYIERGGKDLIRIIDNGCGIEKDDMRAAFFPHATSKIINLEDIYDIKTLGFRGEALATICSVALVELVSAVDGQEANKVECDGEFIGKVQPAVCEKGTQITVRNLFLNTPVRFKFMKSDKKEESDITTYVTHYILGNPSISFKYYVDGKLTLQSYGGGLEEAITQIYGANYLPNCFKISADRNDIKISGFIGNQNFFKSNKTYQTTFLNGRCISNPVISGAITNAYSAYAMKRQYPFYVLFFDVSNEIVDVNVHPNKSDVRFVDNSMIYGTVYKVISSILDGTAKAADFVVDDGKAEKETAKPAQNVYAADYSSDEKVYDKDFNGVVGIEKYVKKPEEKPKKPENQTDYSVYESYEAPDLSVNPRTDLPLHEYYGGNCPNQEGVRQNTICVNDESADFITTGRLDAIEARAKAEQERIDYLQYKYRGVLFNTYLMYEVKDEVYMIDQHAAHERLIYDNLCEKLKQRKLAKQGMIAPYMLRVNQEEKRFLEENMDAIWSMGFSVEQFGTNYYKVYETPADLPDLNLKAFFDDLLSEVSELKSVKLEDIMRDKIAQTACKHAIKGGDELTEDERKQLFRMLKENMGLKCPHGRPVCVKLTKTTIEKMFKRKV